MPKSILREPQKITVDEYFSIDADLPEKIELWDGVIGPYSDVGKSTMLANWGADKFVELTGPEIWCEAVAAYDGRVGNPDR